MGALDLLFEGHPIDMFWSSLGGTFIGSWIYVLILLALDATVLIKVRQIEPVAIMNLLVLYTIKPYLPIEAVYFIALLSILAAVYSFITMLTSRG